MLCVHFLKCLFFLQLLIFVFCQDPVFDIPVQLVGFPVIALSVRLANFAKKLMYSLNPGTYKTISKRSYEKHPAYVLEIKNNIIEEFGETSCIEDESCKYYSMGAGQSLMELSRMMLNFRKDEDVMSDQEKWRLLSAFVGTLTKNPRLCSALGEELPCKRILRDK